MLVNIYCISKPTANPQESEFVASIRQFGVELKILDLWNSDIAKAQKNGDKNMCQEAYLNAFAPKLDAKDSTLHIALSPNGASVDSFGFADMLKDKMSVNFYIGGAYGFNQNMLSKCKNLSLSKLTFSHKIAKLVLAEQIFRAYSILNNHPYHK